MLLLASILAGACAAHARPGDEVARRGEEIMVCGRLFHVGAPVVLWTDPGGYDGYRVERRFVPWERAGWDASRDAGITEPARFGLRRVPLSPEEFERVRGGGWTLDLLRRHVDQFVIHYDAAGTSRACFRVLHDVRGLSVHFMLDLDGTIYQTLDVKERAWHATVANDRAVGIEIANIGAYPPGRPSPLDRWYARDDRGLRVAIPPEQGDGGLRTPGFVARPARPEPVEGVVQGQRLVMHDLTPEQYRSLIRLTAALHRALPGIALDCPRDAAGAPRTDALSPDELATFRGVLGHFHVQANKIDPGPAFDWEGVLRGAREIAGRR